MPTNNTTKKARVNARSLRREQTVAETKLWLALRSHRFEGVHFRRQHPIGSYVVDFPWHRPPGQVCSPKAKLIIELDGAQHLDQQEYDAERTAFLESKGYRVLRFWNNDVLGNLDGVLLRILEVLKTTPR